MKVSNPSSPSRTGTTRHPRSGKPDGAQENSGFSRLLSDAMGSIDETHVVDSPTQAGRIDALLSLQCISDATEEQNRQRLLHRGEEMLDRLDELRRGLLEGRLSLDNLSELSRLARDRRIGTDDSHLRSILEEIELRAEIELAKFSTTI